MTLFYIFLKSNSTEDKLRDCNLKKRDRGSSPIETVDEEEPTLRDIMSRKGNFIHLINA